MLRVLRRASVASIASPPIPLAFMAIPLPLLRNESLWLSLAFDAVGDIAADWPAPDLVVVLESVTVMRTLRRVVTVLLLSSALADGVMPVFCGVSVMVFDALDICCFWLARNNALSTSSTTLQIFAFRTLPAISISGSSESFSESRP